METKIVWKYPPEQFAAYLRESFYWSLKSHGPIRGWFGSGIWVKTIEELLAAADKDDVRLIIAYTEVAKAQSWIPYARRFWWLRNYDRDVSPAGVYATRHPHEAVNPLSIVINGESRPPVEVASAGV